MGYEFRPYPLYTHYMNGVVERAIYTVDCKARSMLFEAGLLGEFWYLATEHAVYIKNRVLTAVLLYGDDDSKIAVTPFEAYSESNRVPDLVRLRVFGYKASSLEPLDNYPRKHAPRAKDSYLFIGMGSSKVWKLYDLHSRVV